MDETLPVTPRRAVRGRLDYLDKLAADADHESRGAGRHRDCPAGRTLLAAHQPDPQRTPGPLTLNEHAIENNPLKE